MAYYDDEVHPVNRITTDTLGSQGSRVFVLQASIDRRVVTWVIEKEQAVALGRSLPKLLEDVASEFPELERPIVAADPDLALVIPREVAFRVGSIGLGYDRLHDLVVLTLMDARVSESIQQDEPGDDEPPMLYIYTTRGQAILLAQQAERAVAAGRPHCPSCGEPMDEFGHFCITATRRGSQAGHYLL